VRHDGVRELFVFATRVDINGSMNVLGGKLNGSAESGDGQRIGTPARNGSRER
jgi:hypothetical protein